MPAFVGPRCVNDFTLVWVPATRRAKYVPDATPLPWQSRPFQRASPMPAGSTESTSVRTRRPCTSSNVKSMAA
jgi:hypothetical protein